MIKPDGVQRRLVGEVVSRFEKKGFQLIAMKMMQPTRDIMEKHYVALKEQAFFDSLIDFMISGPVIAMVKILLSFLYNLMEGMGGKTCNQGWEKHAWKNESC